MQLEQKRQADQLEFEAQKAKKQKQFQHSISINSKFQSARLGSIAEQSFKAQTVGLVTAADFMKAAATKEGTETETTTTASEAMTKANRKKAKQMAKEERKRKKAKKAMSSRLSFMMDEEEEEEAEQVEPVQSSSSLTPLAPVSSKKDPTVDTSFLPDKQRELAEAQKRKELEVQWKEEQIRIQKEALEITYSYWDGSGHRRSITTTKAASIGDFLELVRKDLCGEFRELTTVASDALLYVKEDLIFPHDVTFYDLIVTKARGKSGPLFHFDVHEDVRLGPLDSRVEKDESHPGKVVERRWYERNKHIFPASRWELFDPAKDYGNYTIHGSEVNKKEN